MAQTHQTPGHHPDTAGYQALADLMGNFPEIAVFRRYRSAAALDLLYQQASLHRAIRKWACSFEYDKKHHDPNRSQFDFNFFRLQDSVNPDAPAENGAQWLEWCKISEKLDLYYEKMLRFQKICSLAKVDKYQLRSLRHFLANPDGGNKFLEGVEEDLYDAPSPKTFDDADLISIAHADEPDWFTWLARGPCFWLWHKLWRRNRSGRALRSYRLTDYDPLEFNIIEYSEESIQKTSRVLYSVLTTALVGLAIYTLNSVHSFGGRVGLVLGHNLLFTVGMALLTHVKPVELFAAAAAYAAVLVVFASGSFGLVSSSTSS